MALECSPEEKVNGKVKPFTEDHYCCPPNIGRGLLDDAIYKIWPRDLLMQPIRTIWTILVGDHPGTIPVEFGQITMSGSREDVVWTFSYIIQCKIVTPGWGQF